MIKVLNILFILLISSCANPQFLRHEKGNLLFGETELVEKKGRPKTVVDISRGRSVGQDYLILKPYKHILVERNWVDVYEENAIYEKIPFFSGEPTYDKKPTKGIIEVAQSKSLHLEENFDLLQIKLILSNKTILGKRAADNSYIFPLKDLNFTSKDNVVAKVELGDEI